MNILTYLMILLTAFYCAKDTISFMYPEYDAFSLFLYDKIFCRNIDVGTVKYNIQNMSKMETTSVEDAEKIIKENKFNPDKALDINVIEKDNKKVINVLVDKSVFFNSLYYMLSRYLILLSVFFFPAPLSTICSYLFIIHFFRDLEYKKKNYLVDSGTIKKWCLCSNVCVISFIIWSFVLK